MLSHFGSDHFGLNCLCAQIHFLVPCRPSMEREVLDWQGLRIAGFKDNTYMQLSVADWLALVAPWSGQSPHLNLTTSALGENSSEYTSSYIADRRRGRTLATGSARFSAEEPHRTKRVSPNRSSRSRTPLLHRVLRRTHQVTGCPASPTPTPASPPRRRRRRAGHRESRKIEKRRARPGSAPRLGETAVSPTPKENLREKGREGLEKQP